MTPVSRRAVEAITELNRENEPIGGRLGIPIGGIRQVNVENRPGFVYVRLRDNPNELVQAFNESVSPVYDLPVLVEFKNNRYVVIGRDTNRYSSWGSDSSYLPAHASQHSLLANQLGGGDPVWVDGRQMMPGAVYPSGTLGGPNVLVSEFLFRNKLGNWLYIGNTGTVDINTLRPNGSNARMVLVCLDYTGGGFVLLTGSTFSASLTGTNQIWPFIPNSNLDQVPLAAIRIVSGTTSIGWDNIYDARQWIDSGFVTGSSGGGGISDGDKGDITVSGAGTIWTVDDGVVLGTLLDGLNLNNDQSIADANSLIQAFGRLQAQINNLNSGWISSPYGWNFSSSDSPIFVVNIHGDVTGTIGIGDRVWVNHLGIDKYFIVHGVNSLVSGTYYPYILYGGTDYTLTTGTISSPRYSRDKWPFGFPTDKNKWTVTLSNTSNASQSSPTADVWYNLGSINIFVPIGVWDANYSVDLQVQMTLAATAQVGVRATLSTSTGTFSDAGWTNGFLIITPTSAGLAHRLSINSPRRTLTVTSKTQYYLIALSSQTVTSFSFRGDIKATEINLTSAYL